jgi:hypothetical protein
MHTQRDWGFQVRIQALIIAYETVVFISPDGKLSKVEDNGPVRPALKP